MGLAPRKRHVCALQLWYHATWAETDAWSPGPTPTHPTQPLARRPEGPQCRDYLPWWNVDSGITCVVRVWGSNVQLKYCTLALQYYLEELRVSNIRFPQHTQPLPHHHPLAIVNDRRPFEEFIDREASTPWNWERIYQRRPMYVQLFHNSLHRLLTGAA
jgi:hypothetical protein